MVFSGSCCGALQNARPSCAWGSAKARLVRRGCIKTTKPTSLRDPSSSFKIFAAKKPGVDGKPYVAKNTFVVAVDEKGLDAKSVAKRFFEEMNGRVEKMKTMKDYVRSSLTEVGGNEWEFEQEWETKEGYERWMNESERRKSHFPNGVYQIMPKDKWSVPENFAPIIKRRK